MQSSRSIFLATAMFALALSGNASGDTKYPLASPRAIQPAMPNAGAPTLTPPSGGLVVPKFHKIPEPTRTAPAAVPARERTAPVAVPARERKRR